MAKLYMPTHAEWRSYCKTITLNTGIDMGYIELGDTDKETVVFVHGYADSSLMYHAITSRMQDDYHIYCVDMRGHGISSKPEQYAYTIMQIRDDVVDFLSQMGIDNCYMVGESMGSMVTQAVAFTSPERVKKIALISTFASLSDTPEGLDRTLREYTEWTKNDIDLEQFVPNYRAYKEQEFFPVALEIMNNWPLHCWLAGWRGMELSDNRNFLQYIKAPTIIFWGAEDEVVSPAMKQETSKLMSNAKVVVYENHTHNLSQEVPDEIAEELKVFFN